MMKTVSEIGDILIEASINGDLAEVQANLAACPECISASDSDGLSALHWACICAHTDIIKVLLAAGAVAGAVTGSGSTALHDACRNGMVEVARLLLNQSGASDLVRVPSVDGNTPLHEASRGDHAACVELLLQHGACIDALSCSGNSALHWASMWGAASVVTVLIKNGADTEITNKAGKSALEVVISVNETGKEAVIKAFEEAIKNRKLAQREKRDREDEERRQDMLHQRRVAREGRQVVEALSMVPAASAEASTDRRETESSNGCTSPDFVQSIFVSHVGAMPEPRHCDTDAHAQMVTGTGHDQTESIGKGSLFETTVPIVNKNSKTCNLA